MFSIKQAKNKPYFYALIFYSVRQIIFHTKFCIFVKIIFTKFNKTLNMKILFTTFLFAVAFTVSNLNAATHTVTKNNDVVANIWDIGEIGTLRRTIADANSGDTIVFASEISSIYLEGRMININKKDLTIIGGENDDKVTIFAGYGSIFNIWGDSTRIVNIVLQNLIFTGVSPGGDDYGTIRMMYGNLFTINCEFINNATAALSGAVNFYFGNYFALNCKFNNNYAGSGAAGAVTVNTPQDTLIIINCEFINNEGGGGALIVRGTLIAINCTFSENTSRNQGGGIYLPNGATGFLYHCTFDRNQARVGGAGIDVGSNSKLYSYNCIYTGNKSSNNMPENDIRHQIHISPFGATFSGGDNLIQSINGVTRDLVFGDNVLTDGYIIPLEYASIATKLNNTIQVPAGMTVAEILNYLATDQIGTVRPITGNVTYGAIEIADIKPPPPTYTLTVNTTTGGTTNPSGTSTRDSNETVVLTATADSCYKFTEWGNGSIENPLTVIITSNTVLIANFEFICDTTKFTIWINEHKNIDPTSRNYRIPIYIKADENTVETKIEKLVIEIDRNIFYPRRVEPNTVNMNLNFIDSIIEMTFENITVPALLANEEKILLTIRGDIILGNKESCEITLKHPVKFAQDLDEYPELINGFLSLTICEDGSNRFLTIFDYSPSITVKENIVSEMLEIECKTIERGDYSLEIVDLLGNATTVETWTVAGSTRIFDFKIDISNFAIGSYFIVMNTPTNKYSARFVKQ